MSQLATKTLVIGSGKGGVGKSTVTINLACALAAKGYRVGVLDADLYGPSIPIMTGLRRLTPEVSVNSEGQETIHPFNKFGIKILSIGFFLEEARAVLFRGPMLHSLLQKMTLGVEWGPLDLLLIDLPPGTGDVPLSLSQLLTIDGALLVTTPQEVALLDALKAVNAFDQLGIPVVGVIENMAGFKVPGSDEIHHIFGEAGGKKLAERIGVPLLAQIPLMVAIRRGGDEGIPSAYHTGDQDAGRSFRELGELLWR